MFDLDLKLIVSPCQAYHFYLRHNDHIWDSIRNQRHFGTTALHRVQQQPTVSKVNDTRLRYFKNLCFSHIEHVFQIPKLFNLNNKTISCRQDIFNLGVQLLVCSQCCWICPAHACAFFQGGNIHLMSFLQKLTFQDSAHHKFYSFHVRFLAWFHLVSWFDPLLLFFDSYSDIKWNL